MPAALDGRNRLDLPVERVSCGRLSGFRDRVPTLTEPSQVHLAAPRSGERPVLTMLAGPAVGVVVPIGRELSIGRSDRADLGIDEPTVSWNHARISHGQGALVIEDLGSTNGTFVSRSRIDDPVMIGEGVRIGIGPRVLLKLSFHDPLEERASRQLYESAMRDPLTGLYNRRYLAERLRSEFSYAARNGVPLSVLLTDIDHFKRINDRAGHAMGDSVLRVVAETLRRLLRPEDVLARFGGEEFLIVARGVDRNNAMIMGERIRAHVQRLRLPPEVEIGWLTVSVGVASLQPGVVHDSPEEIVAAADEAMYGAKSAGRNRVVAA
jgi:two-component system, cell cycle response regulator